MNSFLFYCLYFLLAIRTDSICYLSPNNSARDFVRIIPTWGSIIRMEE